MVECVPDDADGFDERARDRKDLTESGVDNGEEHGCTAERLKFAAVAAFLLSVTCIVSIDACTTRYFPTGVKAYVRWTVGHAPASLLLYLLACAVAVTMAVPIMLFAAASGPLFATVYGETGGICLATLAMCTAETLGGCVGMLAARNCFQSRLQLVLRSDPKLKALRAADGLMESNGLIMVLVLKNVPLPAGYLYWMFGCTRLKVCDLVISATVFNLFHYGFLIFATVTATHPLAIAREILSSPLSAVSFFVAAAALVALFAGSLWQAHRKYQELLEESEGPPNELAPGGEAAELLDGP